jgi:predicted dehydrogenase
VKGRRLSRRAFLGQAAEAGAAIALFSIVPARVVAGLKSGRKPPSETVTRAVIGTGGMGMGHIETNRDGEVPATLAVCDVDADHLAEGLKKAGKGCEAYHDFRRVLERKDIDVIHVVTPPHWHALISIAAMQAGKDVLCEKPVTKFHREGLVMIEAAKRYGRILQVNSYGRTGYEKLRRVVMSSVLGTPLTVRLNPNTGTAWKVAEWSGRTDLVPEKIPKVLDYDFWLGPAPVKPYHPHRVHQSFRGYWDYDGGGLADMGMHWMDPILYALGKDLTGPSLVESTGPWPPHPDAAGMWGTVTFTWPDGTRLLLESDEWGPKVDPKAPFMEGPKGKALEREGTESDPPGLFAATATIPVPVRDRSFEDAVKTRDNTHTSKPTGEEAHRTVTHIHLANIAIRTGRPVRWDPVRERVIGDAAQDAMLDEPMRKPWHL